MKILIVDDSKQMRQMIRTYLQNLAEDIRECEDGADALSAYESFEPDWVLMDWKMNQIDGLAATRQILKAYPSAQILFITQFEDEFLRQSALEAGARDYILKEDLFRLRKLLTSK